MPVPHEKLKVALAPTPFANGEEAPLPASVVTTPVGVMARMRWLLLSAT